MFIYTFLLLPCHDSFIIIIKFSMSYFFFFASAVNPWQTSCKLDLHHSFLIEEEEEVEVSSCSVEHQSRVSFHIFLCFLHSCYMQSVFDPPAYGYFSPLNFIIDFLLCILGIVFTGGSYPISAGKKLFSNGDFIHERFFWTGKSFWSHYHCNIFDT